MKDTIKINSGNTKIIAHRGVSGLERENTCPAFVAAGNRSYFGVETDVHVTKDGKFVIIHDETTDRVSNGAYSINVEESDFSAIKDVVLPDMDGSVIRQDIRIPSLAEYISICKKYGKTCVLEVKNHFEKTDLQKLVNEVSGYIDNIIFISFDLPNCIELRKLLPNSRVQWLIGENDGFDDETVGILINNRLDLDINYKMLTKETVCMLHDKGISVNCWTCDDAKHAEKLLEMGVDFITTNILE